MRVKSNLWGLWSSKNSGLGWVQSAVGIRLCEAEILLADRLREKGEQGG